MPPRALRAVLLLGLATACLERRPAGVVIEGAAVIDGLGGPRKVVDVRVEGDSIAQVGQVGRGRGDLVVDGRGLVLAPGFIDTHSHASRDLDDDTTALGAVSQGITTIVAGQDGGSDLDLAGWFDRRERRPAPVNVASYVGHGTIRRHVLGGDFRREATRAEIDLMSRLVQRGMDAGALGLSTGLEYDPGIYSSTEEVIELAKVSAAAGGRYISHIRSEDYRFWQAIDEIVRIGREARLPVQVSHAKLAMRDLWGRADSLIKVLNAARAAGVEITADVYPYLYWQSTLTVLFPKRDFTNRAAANFALTQTSTASGLLLAAYAPHPEWVGRTVADVARERGVDSVTALIDLIRGAEEMEKRLSPDSLALVDTESVIGTSMVEEDVEAIMRWPYTNFCTDGALTGSHPRGFGSFPRVLGEYVRRRGTLTLEEAIHRATRRAALNMGFNDRGVIAPGAPADLVLFSATEIVDRATPRDPHAVSEGVRLVMVNGSTVFRDGAATGTRAGRVLRRE